MLADSENLSRGGKKACLSHKKTTGKLAGSSAGGRGFQRGLRPFNLARYRKIAKAYKILFFIAKGGLTSLSLYYSKAFKIVNNNNALWLGSVGSVLRLNPRVADNFYVT